jgi:type II secretory pathway predicted ATPase ExeA
MKLLKRRLKRGIMSNHISIYEKPKMVFLDTVDVKNYVHMDRSSAIYQSLKETIQKPLKMILLFGRPGTGKSMLLSKLYNDLVKKQKIHLYSTPLLDESEFFKSLAADLFNVRYNGELNLTQFTKIAKNYLCDEVPLILLDEAQLYPPELMEKIRLLSDSRIVKFVIVLHKTEKEDLIAKEHFQTRIWESIELENAKSSEIKAYIQKKLMKENCFDIANMFSDNSANLIHKITNGNYRDTNKLLHSVFEIYEWYEINQPYKLDKTMISNKIVEMAGISTGLLHA